MDPFQTPEIKSDDRHLVMPGMATVHSHAFQRLLRGRTQRRQTSAVSFWSWRGLMYALAERLDPDDLYHIARLAYAELAMGGVTAVGEFHYLHHDRGGKPYPNRTELSEVMIRAALEVGLRICLIRTAYRRAGFQQTLAPAQARFVDPALEPILRDIADLQDRFGGDPRVSIGAAAHSIRAVSLAEIERLAVFAGDRGLPLHMHICEQRRELEEALAEYGATPVALLAERGVLSERFVAVHATHLNPAEIAALGAARAFICLCRTTERDLGDGLPETSALLASGARLTVGVDSHAGADPFEEIRAVELDERSRTETRLAAADAGQLLDAATRLGYKALGFEQAWTEDRVFLDKNDPSLLGYSDGLAADAVMFGATPRAVHRVVVAGRVIVDGGKHVLYEEIATKFLKTVKKLAL